MDRKEQKLYQELFDLMFKGESVNKIPAFFNWETGRSGMGTSTQGRYNPYQMSGNPIQAAGRSLGILKQSNAPLDPWIDINMNQSMKERGLLEPKNLRYTMVHELGHAKDYQGIAKKMSPREFRQLMLDSSKGRYYQGGLFGSLASETRGANIHMPFLREHFGKDALTDFRKKDFILKENLGKYPSGKIAVGSLIKEIQKVHGSKYSSPMLKELFSVVTAGGEGKIISTGVFKYKNLAKIAGKAGLMGLLLMAAAPMMFGGNRSE